MTSRNIMNSHCVILIDREGSIIFVNSTLLEIIGYTREDVVGKSLTFLQSPTMKHSHAYSIWKQYKKDNRPTNFKMLMCFMTNMGIEFTVRANVKTMVEDGKVQKYFLSFIFESRNIVHSHHHDIKYPRTIFQETIYAKRASLSNSLQSPTSNLHQYRVTYPIPPFKIKSTR